jgi:hypothetical protein
MHDERSPPLPSLPVANYSSAIARAVAWLGDRYLLARPMNASQSRSTGRRARRIAQASIVTIDAAG